MKRKQVIIFLGMRDFLIFPGPEPIPGRSENGAATLSVALFTVLTIMAKEHDIFCGTGYGIAFSNH